MFSMTILWLSPMPRVKRFPEAAATVWLCWAIAWGWRGNVGTTAVPSSMRPTAVLHHRQGGQCVVAEDIGHPVRGETVPFGRGGLVHHVLKCSVVDRAAEDSVFHHPDDTDLPRIRAPHRSTGPRHTGPVGFA